MKNIKNVKSVKQFIKAMSQNEGYVDASVVWVDELPNEKTLWELDAPEDYRGYRNMEQSSRIERLNSHMAVMRSTYNAGPWGYLHYNAVLYVKRSIWKEFHIDPYSIKEARLRASDSSKGFSLLWDITEKGPYETLEIAKSVARVFSGSRIVLA